MNLLGKGKSGPTTASSVEVRGKIIRELPGALDLRRRTSTRFNLKFLLVPKKKEEKKTPRKASLYFFLAKKVNTVIYTEGGQALSR